MIKYDGYEIHLGRNINKIQIKTQCPKCKELGKTNYKDTCLSVSMDKKILNCHKCGWHGYFGELTKKDKIEFVKPDTKNFTELKLDHLQRFSNRGINQDILKFYQV